MQMFSVLHAQYVPQKRNYVIKSICTLDDIQGVLCTSLRASNSAHGKGFSLLFWFTLIIISTTDSHCENKNKAPPVYVVGEPSEVVTHLRPHHMVPLVEHSALCGFSLLEGHALTKVGKTIY